VCGAENAWIANDGVCVPHCPTQPTTTINADDARALIACVYFMSGESICPDAAWDAAERIAKDLGMPPLSTPEDSYAGAGFYNWRNIG
jgi:hypothetical protein